MKKNKRAFLKGLAAYLFVLCGLPKKAHSSEEYHLKIIWRFPFPIEKNDRFLMNYEKQWSDCRELSRRFQKTNSLLKARSSYMDNMIVSSFVFRSYHDFAKWEKCRQELGHLVNASLAQVKKKKLLKGEIVNILVNKRASV